MMAQSIDYRVQRLIEETNSLFYDSGSVNTDYADFATLALQDFRSLLGMPGLTDRELKQFIRRAALQHKVEKAQSCWASFTASYMTQKANENRQIA